MVDYFSRYCEIGVLRKSTSQEVIDHLKAVFPRHGFQRPLSLVMVHNIPQRNFQSLLMNGD